MNKPLLSINIITYNNNYGLTKDINILKNYLIKNYEDKYILDIKNVNFYDFETRYAHINIFLETVSYILMKHYYVNILIPNK
jgi:hypothetical protein